MATIEHGQRAADMKAILQTPPDQAAIARLSEDPVFNATMRTTCVATRLAGGHANNALPQTATANVNCRILPGHSREEVRQQLVKVFDDPKVEVRYLANDGATLSGFAPEKLGYAPVKLRPDVMQPLEKVAAQMWPGAPVIPTMATGASDGVYTNAAGLPTFGISGIAIDMDDVRAHGKDERLGVQSYYNGVQFYYQFLKAITGGK